MTTLPPDPRRLPTLHPPLLIGTLSLSVVIGFLLRTGGPIGVQPIHPIIAPAMAVMGILPMTMALTWGLRQVPRLPAGMSPTDYWAKVPDAPRALLVWVLLTGGTLIPLVGTLLTGSLITAAVAAVGILLLAAFRPAYFVER